MLGQLPLVLFLKLFDIIRSDLRGAETKSLFYVAALCIKGGLSRALSWNAEENIFGTFSPSNTHTFTHTPTHRTADMCLCYYESIAFFFLDHDVNTI